MVFPSFLLMLISASALPLLAFIALFLRTKKESTTFKRITLIIGVTLLSVALYSTFHEHGEDITLRTIIISGIVGLITLFILARFSSHHHHDPKEGGVKGIVISEAFHSLIDGTVIGATYLLNPFLGYAATVGIIIHEFPKIIGTLTLFRGLGLSVRKTITYGAIAQGGSPIAALLVYLLGKDINHEQFHLLEFASITSLSVIVLWIIYLEIRYHKKHTHAHDH